MLKNGDRQESLAPPYLVSPFTDGQPKDGEGSVLFATRDIEKGEMTYGGTRACTYTSGHDYRRYFDAFDDEMACNMMKFTWPQKGVGKWKICVEKRRRLGCAS